MRGVTKKQKEIKQKQKISTHTPHARRDVLVYIISVIILISTHTPHARRDKLYYRLVNALLLFQLTRLMRGVTTFVKYSWYSNLHFNSHASCEAWPQLAQNAHIHHQNFNSHASCEAWPWSTPTVSNNVWFQLTRLMRGVTLPLRDSNVQEEFQLTRLMRGVT